MVEHNPYLLIFEFAFLASMLWVWWRNVRLSSDTTAGLASHGENFQHAQAKQNKRQHLRASRTSDPTIARQVKQVPIPWGWPHHRGSNRRRANRPSASESMHYLLDCLIREKQLADRTHLDPRSSNSVRALLEDRYGPVNRDRMTEMPYHVVKAPLLRDPNAPHDQMDNFGFQGLTEANGKLVRIRGAKDSIYRQQAARDRLMQMDIKEIKRPWGW